MIKYFKMYKEADAKPFEVSKEEAIKTLSGYWNNIDDVFDGEKGFRLFTPFSEVWTEKDGLIPTVGFYGVCE